MTSNRLTKTLGQCLLGRGGPQHLGQLTDAADGSPNRRVVYPAALAGTVSAAQVCAAQ